MAAVKTRIWRGGLAEMLKSGGTPAASEPPPPDDEPTTKEEPVPSRSGKTQTFTVDKTRLPEPEPSRRPSPRTGSTLMLNASDLTEGAPEKTKERHFASTRILPIETFFGKQAPSTPPAASLAEAPREGKTTRAVEAPRAAKAPRAAVSGRALLQKLGRPVLYTVLVLGAAGSWYARLAREEAAAAPEPSVAPAQLPEHAESAPPHVAAPSTPAAHTTPSASEAAQPPQPPQTAQPATGNAKGAPPQATPSTRDALRAEALAVAPEPAREARPTAAQRRAASTQPKRLPRAAVDALAAGDYDRARKLYAELARAMPEQPAFAEALRILQERASVTD